MVEHKFLTVSLAQFPLWKNTRQRQTCRGGSIRGPKFSWDLEGRKPGRATLSQAREEPNGREDYIFLQAWGKDLGFTAFWEAQAVEGKGLHVQGLQWWTELLSVPTAAKGLLHTARETYKQTADIYKLVWQWAPKRENCRAIYCHLYVPALGSLIAWPTRGLTEHIFGQAKTRYATGGKC